jgi:4-amino-4-deoxy-L-arabinose transferase-like glycosyltransferase
MRKIFLPDKRFAFGKHRVGKGESYMSNPSEVLRQKPNNAVLLDGVGIAVWCIAGATLVLHLATATGYGIFRDEFYYIACSEHLALGYVDHPPLSIAFLAAWRAIFGDSMLSLRIPPSILHAGVVLLFGFISRELGARKFGRMLAALAAAIMPVYLGSMSFYSMNAFDTFFWALCIYILCRIINTGNARLWLLFGLIAGLGLQNKFSVGFLGAALVAGLILSPHRKHFLSPYLYAGGAIALIIFFPHIVWLYKNSWITFEFMRNASLHKNSPTNPLKFFGDQLLMAHPLLLPVWLTGIVYCLVSPRVRAFRMFSIMFVGLFFFFSLTRGKSYYLAPAYALVMPAGAIAFERLCGGRMWAKAILLALFAITGAAIAPLAVPIFPPDTLLRYQSALGIKAGKQEIGHDAALDQHFADRFGWKELVTEVSNVYAQLPEAERAKCAILCSNYGEAAAIDFYGRKLGLPNAIATHNNYWLWGPRNASPEILMTVGSVGPGIAKANVFESGGEVARSRHPLAEEDEVPICVFRNLKPPATIAALWERNKEMI